ncbi:MAG: glucose-6-phosphate isomerase [Desulfovibrionaceae bacterium]
MGNVLEWSRAVTGRLTDAGIALHRAQYEVLGQRLGKELQAGELPFLTLSYRQRLEEQLLALTPSLRKFKHMLVLGIGGSALGTRALQHAFAPAQNGPNYQGPCLWIADNVCASTFEAWLSALSPAETVVVTISKSGGTIETLAQYFLVREWLQAALGTQWNAHMVVVTDARQGFLRQEASAHHLASLEVPDFLGGRYSALSAVGLVPAAFLGIDWQGLLDGAASVAKPLVDNPASLKNHPSYHLACWCHGLEQAHYSQLIFFSYIPMWATFGPWFAQLWAESLGKDGKGTMPLPATGVTDQHSINQMFLDGPRDKACLFLTCPHLPQGRVFPNSLPEQWSWLRGKAFGALLEAEGLGTRMALAKTQTPLVNIDMGGITPFDAGAMMLMLEATTVFTGWLMGINPLDQPAVELGKRLANTRLGALGYPEEAQDLQQFLRVPDEREQF